MCGTARAPINEADIWARLDRVMDPELDDPVSELGFIEKVTLADDNSVTVDFRLPTYWCAPNFAFLMAEGIHREVSSLPGIGPVHVRLRDHLFGEEMNRGLAAGKPFAEIFSELAQGGSLDEVREKFSRKAFQRRQEPLLRDLRGQGFSDGRIVAMTLAEFDALSFTSDEAKMRAPLYRELLIGRGLATWPSDRAFPDVNGAPIPAEALNAHLHTLRQIRINMEFNGATCRGLLATRYKELAETDGQKTLVDTWPEHRLASVG